MAYFTKRKRSGGRDGVRRYGFFRCDDCDWEWESSHVYCANGTDEALYEQECKSCGTACSPYLVEKIVCRYCQSTDCTCERKKRHVDPSKHHMEELCLRCRSGRKCVRQ